MSEYAVPGGNLLSVRLVMAILRRGPMTRAEIIKEATTGTKQIDTWLKRLQNTKPYNLVYICDYRRSEVNNYPMAVYDVNLTGQPMEPAARPALSRAGQAYRDKKAAGLVKPRKSAKKSEEPPKPPPVVTAQSSVFAAPRSITLRADRQSGEPIPG